MRFIEKYPPGESPPLTLVLSEDKDPSVEDVPPAMKFSLATTACEVIAWGRCSIYRDPDESKYMLISAIYVKGNENNPTKDNPNQYVGLGQLLVFVAMRFGFEHKVRSTRLVPLAGSEGFYIKMGFYPQVTGGANKMVDAEGVPMSCNGKLNPQWMNKFAHASFLNPDFRGFLWEGCTERIYLNLKESIKKSWMIA